MNHRLLALGASVVATTAIGAGVSLAQGGYDHPHDGGKKKAGEDMVASRLSWSAYLNGAAEVDADGDDAGDPDAKGSAMFLQVDERTVCYGFALRGAGTPTIVHIHKGGPGRNGPPVVTFANAPKNASGAPSGNPGASSGCKTTEGAETAALRRIRRNPRRYYVNFHTQEFPDGAVRGQLSRMWYDNTR
jgi:CHRD domain-containing protein